MSTDTQKVRAIVFPGVQNLPGFAAEEHGFFAKRGLAVETLYTQSSKQQRDGLAIGVYDIAHSAVDNAIAMVDVAGKDVVIVIGLDRGFNKLVAQPHIRSYEDLRGKTLAVDAPDTAFALIAYEMLKRRGLNHADYQVKPVGATRFRLEALKEGSVDFSLLNLPFNLFAQRHGLVVLDNPAQVIGDYQSVGAFVQRSWGVQNRDVLVAYLTAYIEGLRWCLKPENRKIATALLQKRMELPPAIAEECIAQVTNPMFGFTTDARINHQGMETVLQLRASFSKRSRSAIPLASKYLDECYYQEALARLN
jgi:ABC-type nitrate/sulfonate/bicarbonate transport system substrate-binding protein